MTTVSPGKKNLLHNCAVLSEKGLIYQGSEDPNGFYNLQSIRDLYWSGITNLLFITKKAGGLSWMLTAMWGVLRYVNTAWAVQEGILLVTKKSKRTWHHGASFVNQAEPMFKHSNSKLTTLRSSLSYCIYNWNWGMGGLQQINMWLEHLGTWKLETWSHVGGRGVWKTD